MTPASAATEVIVVSHGETGTLGTWGDISHLTGLLNHDDW